LYLSNITNGAASITKASVYRIVKGFGDFVFKIYPQKYPHALNAAPTFDNIAATLSRISGKAEE
jgi:hypothetical protein